MRRTVVVDDVERYVLKDGVVGHARLFFPSFAGCSGRGAYLKLSLPCDGAWPRIYRLTLVT